MCAFEVSSFFPPPVPPTLFCPLPLRPFIRAVFCRSALAPSPFFCFHVSAALSVLAADGARHFVSVYTLRDGFPCPFVPRLQMGEFSFYGAGVGTEACRPQQLGARKIRARRHHFRKGRKNAKLPEDRRFTWATEEVLRRKGKNDS